MKANITRRGVKRNMAPRGMRSNPAPKGVTSSAIQRYLTLGYNTSQLCLNTSLESNSHLQIIPFQLVGWPRLVGLETWSVLFSGDLLATNFSFYHLNPQHRQLLIGSWPQTSPPSKLTTYFISGLIPTWKLMRNAICFTNGFKSLLKPFKTPLNCFLKVS